jgi:hypothetical protein
MSKDTPKISLRFTECIKEVPFCESHALNKIYYVFYIIDLFLIIYGFHHFDFLIQTTDSMSVI